MRIDVTQYDIDNGIRCDSKLCPVAIALRRTTGRICEAGASLLWIGNYGCDQPDDVKNFINNFDGGRAVEPFSFELEMS